jgi:hypothetical protein
MTTDPADIASFSRLTSEAVVEISKLIEAAQQQITLIPGAFFPAAQRPAAAITGLIHDTVRGITKAVDRAVTDTCTPSLNNIGEMDSSPVREAVVAALNGVVGDHLAATGNPLAIAMRLRRNGRPLTIERDALLAAIPEATGKLLVLVHGLCRNDLQWEQQDRGHGAALARDLGYTPVYLHYNSGLHISENGQAFAGLLEILVKQWPKQVQELAIVAHSAGGLVSRSACHYGTVADHHWRQYLRHLLFLGTPHHGAPLERWGNLVNANLDLGPFSAPYARLGRIRSAGITDLRYGNVRHEDWQGRDRFALSPDVRTPMPLPEDVRCYAIGATLQKQKGSLRNRVIGDGIVPLDSALGRHQDPAMTLQFARSRQWVGYAMNHSDLLCHPAVYDRILRWLRT